MWLSGGDLMVLQDGTKHAETADPKFTAAFNWGRPSLPAGVANPDDICPTGYGWYSGRSLMEDQRSLCGARRFAL